MVITLAFALGDCFDGPQNRRREPFLAKVIDRPAAVLDDVMKHACDPFLILIERSMTRSG